MKNTEIIETLKNTYPRDLRKKVVKTILADEKENTIPNYTLINQIFSYVLSELGWNMAKDTTEWDSSPLDIMHETFPKLSTTQWYKEQILTAQKTIEVEMKD